MHITSQPVFPKPLFLFIVTLKVFDLTNGRHFYYIHKYAVGPCNLSNQIKKYLLTRINKFILYIRAKCSKVFTCIQTQLL